MSSYQVQCTEQSNPGAQGHGHILAVGTGTTSSRPDQRWTVEEVRRAIWNGHRFYTVSPSTRRIANVERYDCWCGVKTIRSAADAVYDNNLDNLRLCSWR